MHYDDQACEEEHCHHLESSPSQAVECGQPLMMVSNDDVPNGHANGTRVL